MNKQLLFPSAKCLYGNIRGIVLLLCLLGSASVSYAQTVTLTDATGEAGTLTGGQTNVAVFAFNLTRGTAVNLTGVTVTFSTPIAGIFTNVRLFESTDATFSFGGDSNVGTMTLGSGTDYTTTFAARPIAAAGGTFYFIVVNIDPAILSTSTINVTCASTQIVTTDAEAGSATGPIYNSGNITELRADFTQNGAGATAMGDQNGVELLDFTVLSNGAQNITPSLVFTFDVDVTNILENWDLQVGGADIPGVENYALTGGGTILTVTGFTNVDVSTTKNFQLFADIKSTATSANDFTMSLASSGVTVDVGYPEAFTTFTNAVDVTALMADFTQNADAATALADQNSVELLDFDVLSNGTQSITPSLVFTFDVDITNILENWDLRVAGADIPGTENYALTGGGTILTVTGFTNVDVSTTKNFQLFADIKSTATSANDFVITLQTSGVAVNLGYAETFTFTNSVDVTGLTADFTQNADVGSAVADENGVELLDFTVLSNGTQNIVSPLVFTFNVDVTNILENWDLRVGGADIPGSENYVLSGGGTILTVTAFTNVDVSTTKNFQLYADIRVGALTTNDFTITLAPTGVAVDAGLVEAFGTFTNAVDITVSALSNIVFTGGSGIALNYRTRQAVTIDNTDLNGSFRLATFSLQDGGGASDPDVKATSIESITFQIDNPDNIRRIALFNETNSQANDDTEIAGTEQDMPASGMVTFTPLTPIRTLADGGNWNFMVRVTFKSTVVDNQVLTVTVNSVTGETEYSAFTSTNAGGANSSAGPNKTIIVTASKIKFNPAVVSTSPISTNFGPVTIVAVDGNAPLSNVDLDYNGKVDLTASGGSGVLTGGGQKTLSAGQVIVPTLSINQSGNYTLEVSDDEYNDAPDNQPSLEDVTSAIAITSSASTLNLPSALNLCYGGSFQTLGNILITETDAAGFSSSGSFSIALPTGFVFDTNTNPTLSMSNSTTNFASVGFTGDNIVQFTYSMTAGSTNTNALTISNLLIRYPGSAAPSGGNQITRSGGTATIAGVGAGVQLGTVNAALGIPPGSLGFTVQALAGDVAVDPNQTNFSINGNAVQLTGTPAGGVFSGSGITQVSGSYRFNPSSLSAGTYPITYTYTNPSGQNCQFTFSKNFIVYSSGINNLGPLYCTNDATTGIFSVDPTFLNSIGPNLEVSRYVYYNFSSFSWINITNPSSDPTSTVFNPNLTEYQSIYNQGLIYGYPVGILIGFYVADATTHTEVGFGRWQVVEVRPAPSVNFTSSSNTYIFCEDNTPITLIGSPPNSNNTTLDRFDAGGNGVAAITNAIVAGKEVWTFSPAAVTGVGASTPQTFNITYKYTDPVTTCDATFVRSFKVKDRPSSVVDTDITDSPFTVPHTAIELCQGGVVGSFSAPNLGSPLNAFYTWYADAGLTIPKGRGDTFVPPIDNTIAQTTNFYVTQTTQREAFMFFGTEIVTFEGCESDKGSAPDPLELDVVVNATPAAPTIANATKAYCINQSIPNADLAVGGTAIKWYTGAGILIPGAGASPTAAQLGINNTVAGTYSFYATQTLSGCEGTIPASALFVTVTIKPLPVVSVVPDNIDPMKICKTGDPITFRAFDGGSPALQPPGTITWSGVPGLIPQQADGIATLNPATALLTPADYVLTVNYTTGGTNCSNSTNLNLRVLPTVDPSVIIGTACDSSSVSINNTSIMVQPAVPYVPAASVSSISKISWKFGDDGNVVPGADGSYLLTIPVNTNGGRTTGTYKNPLHRFEDDGSYQLSYEITTTDGCVIKPIAQPIVVSPKPKIDFDWQFPCRDITTGLSSTSFTAIEQSTPVIPITTYEWDFNVGNTLSFTTGNTALSNPVVTYNANGQDFAELIVTTLANCKDTIRKQISILPTYPTITATTGYDQNFNSGSNFWFEGGVRSSWALGSTTPVAIPTNGASWATGLSSSNNADEQSWVMSGCFNFSDSEKPVISLDIWSETPDGVDGAVLQFNDDGLIENEGSWQVLGDASSGINWYDGSGISNSPGNQSSNDYGWTGTYADWKKAIYKLDAVKPASPTASDSLIIFRVAFAGGNRQLSGFAFDNVFIGERSRVVLLENFTNTVPISTNVAPTTNHNAVYESFGNVSSNELVKIQYHTPFPGDDELNKENQQMNNSRAAFYGITEAPTARVDGGFQAGNLGSWLTNYNDDRVLTPSVLTIDTTSITKVGTDVKINLSIENTTSQKLPLDGVNVFTVIVQKQIDKAGNESLFGNIGNTKFVYVAKQMLPTAAGIPLSDSLASGVPLQLPEITWSNPNGGDAIVIFVQRIDGDNKNVYQSILVRNPPTPDVVTGTEDDEYAKHIYLYPNPANHQVNIELPAAVNKSTPIEMYDAFGRVVYQSAFNAGEKTKTVSTSSFADGIYMMQLITPNGSKVVRKVMITHR